MAFALTWKMEGRTVTKRLHARIMRTLNQAQALRSMGRMPRHFQSVPETRPGGDYDYEPRDKGYQINKAKIKRHQRPLVFTEELFKTVMGSMRTTATPTRMVLRAKASFALTHERKTEIETVGARELEQDLERYERDYVRMANDPAFQERFSKGSQGRDARGRFTG